MTLTNRIRAADVHTPVDEFRACVQWASRTNPTGSSNKRLRVLVNHPDVLEYLERVTDLRSHEPPRNSGEGTAVNGPMPLGEKDESRTAEPE